MDKKFIAILVAVIVVAAIALGVTVSSKNGQITALQSQVDDLNKQLSDTKAQLETALADAEAAAAAAAEAEAAAAEAAAAAAAATASASGVAPDPEDLDAMDYDEASNAVYDYALGEYYDTYSVAKAELDDTDKRLALMAIAEAKLLESGVFLPVDGDGGAFALSCIVPRTDTTTSWGLDKYKYTTRLIADKPITIDDRNALISMWGEAADADTYLEEAKAYLAEHGYGLTDSYNFNNSYELQTWDTIASSYTSDSFFIAPTWSGLLEYDAKDVQQPGLAESYEISEDGLTYTFHIRQGVKWVDQQGREIADVTADDWVASMQHVADNNDALGYLMSSSDGCGIKNYDAYIAGEVTDFAEVGVKAVDDYTLQYTLEQKFPPFITMMGYGCFAPLNRAFYESQGGKFGADYDPSAADYNYGKTPANIAYCGAYLITNYTEKNVTAYAPNPTYWNKDAVNTPYINIYYVDGTDPLRSFNDFKAGTIVHCGLNSSALVMAKEEKPEGEDASYFDLYHYTTTNSATTYCGWMNINRTAFANYNDPSKGVSPMTDEQKLVSRKAMLNQHFRLALAMGFDRASYESQEVGEELKYAAIKNAYVTGAFSKLAAETTVDINGTATTFPAGTYYGVIQQAQLDADGCPLKVWDPEADGGVGSGDGFDGWYNPENAAAQLDLAIAELAEQGVEISAENPVYIDYPYGSYDPILTNRANVVKQSIEASLGGKVIVNLIAFEDRTTMNDAVYRISTGDEANFTLSTGSGWGPDYGDPQSFLDTINPYGYMAKNLGIF